MSFIYLNVNSVKYRFPYVGSIKIKFRYRINNKLTHKKFRRKYLENNLTFVISKSELRQKLFHETTVQKVTKELKIGASLS